MKLLVLVSILILIIGLVHGLSNSEPEARGSSSAEILEAIRLRKINGTSVIISIGSQVLEHGQPKLSISVRHQLLPGQLGVCVGSGEEGKSIRFNQTWAVQSCEQKLFMFNGCSSSLGSLNATTLCSTGERRLSFPEARSIEIADLLPGQSYAFQVQVSHEQSQVQGDKQATQKVWRKSSGDDYWKIICTDETEPVCRPELDLGSFVIHDQADARNSARLVDVYFRPVPRALHRGALSQVVKCVEFPNKVINYHVASKIESSGRVSFTALTDKTYICQVWSENDLGRSSSTVIKIPRQHNTIRRAHDLQVHATATEEGQYRLRWPTIEKLVENWKMEISDSVAAEMKGNFTGVYTAYWCRTASSSERCQGIEGMLTTSNSTLTVRIPSSGSEALPYLQFGLSYRSVGNELFSGIQWADCTTSREEYQSLNGTLKLHALAHRDETSISVGWKFTGCKAVVSAITSYEFRYYQQNIYNHCPLSVDWSSKKAPIWLDDRAFSSVRLNNELQFETLLDFLEPSSLYIIRMRAVTVDGQFTTWSKPIVAATEPTLDMKESCLKVENVIWFSAFAVIFLVVGFAFVCCRVDKKPSTGANTSPNANINMTGEGNPPAAAELNSQSGSLPSASLSSASSRPRCFCVLCSSRYSEMNIRMEHETGEDRQDEQPDLASDTFRRRSEPNL